MKRNGTNLAQPGLSKRVRPGIRILLALPILASLSACQEAVTQEAAQPLPESPSVTPRPADPAWIKAPCVLVPQRMVKLKPELGGAIDRVLVRLGDTVVEGQLLAVLRTRELALDLARQRNQGELLQERIRLLEMQLIKAEREWATLQSLYVAPAASGALMAKEAMAVLEKKSELAQLRLQTRDHQLQMERLERLIAQAEIRSPMRGVVLSRNAEIGMVVAPGGASFNGSDILFEVGDPDRLKAECAARESDATRLRVGAPVRLKLDGPQGYRLDIKISGVAPAVSNQGNSTSLSFWAEFEREPGSTVLPGMHGTAEVMSQASSAMAAALPQQDARK